MVRTDIHCKSSKSLHHKGVFWGKIYIMEHPNEDFLNLSDANGIKVD